MEASKLFKSAGIVSLATMVSRLAGLVREQVFAVIFGAGLAVDSFVAAFRIPNLLRDLLGEGVLSTAFVPVFTEDLTRSGKEGAWRTANIVISTVIVVTGIIVLLGILASPWLVKAIAPGFGKIAGKWELTTLLTRIMFPFLTFISLAAVAMGIRVAMGHTGATAAETVADEERGAWRERPAREPVMPSGTARPSAATMTVSPAA